MPTSQRWAGRPPTDLTARRQRELIAKRDRDQKASKLTAAELQQIRAAERQAGYTDGYVDGAEWAAERLLDSGVIAEDALRAVFATAAGHRDQGDEG